MNENGRKTDTDTETVELEVYEGDEEMPTVIPVEIRLPEDFAGKTLRLEIDLSFGD